ncbi:hypothetical protein LOAG_02250 [Loa loa]|uniref:Uncharacterized protein n=1 Tax=Loa loa TaxID=7209 RepID=A0A1S0U6W7_LOALO|nr:hypothetical protein LOAG_02250 [Loa loa]EFO26238.1 hypothetical protein LOAG_02250 [Loa loa]
MYSVRMVVMFLLIVLVSISIIIRNTEGDNKHVIIDERFGDNISKYQSNNTRYDENNHEDIKYEEFDIKKSKRKSLKQDIFMLHGSNKFKVSYPPAKYRFFKTMLNKDLCDQYTLECIYYRSEYPRSRLSFDWKTGKEYNPCHRFVEPCFGISEYDYKIARKFKSLKDY